MTVPLTRRDPLRRAEVIVVPGARVRPDGTLSRSARERITTACALHREGWAPWLLLSGGSPDGGPIEAAQMAKEARRLGVPETSLLLEPNSRDTWENAEFSAALLRGRGLTHAIVVTHPFHTRRVARALLRRGVLVQAFPVTRSWMESGERQAIQLVVREYAALLVDLTGGRR